MLDIRWIRERPEWVRERLLTRGSDFGLEALREMEMAKRALQTETEVLQSRRNALSREVGQARARGEDADPLMREVGEIGPRLQDLGRELKEREEELTLRLAGIPNLPHDSAPVGPDAAANVEVRRVGTPREMDYPILDHVALGEKLKILDFEAGAFLAQARFTVLRGAGARLSRALIQFMLDLHTLEHGYQEILPPFLANAATLTGTGQLPKFEEDLFRCREDGLYLIPTAEVPLTNLVRGKMLQARELPLRMTAWTPCFRREAGAAGKDTRGLIRQHQFDKVELVWVTLPEESDDALETMTRHAEEVLRRLELPYRVICLCTGDMGFSAAKTYDIEVWLPGQGTYREISSCSNCEGFQARRMQTRVKREGNRVEPVHTLNGSGVAVGRCLIALLENHQLPDGSVRIPQALRPYMGGMERIVPPECA